MEIRNATPEDTEALVGLLAELFALEADFAPDPERQRRGLALMLDGCLKHKCVKVAVRGGLVVGMVCVQTLVSTAEGGMVGLVEDMVVRPDHRGRGVGRRLLEAAGQWAETRGLLRLQLLADRENRPALDFYVRCGWRTTQLICLRKKETPGSGGP